ncbi:uncharacterized protein PHACADRAFT_246166 [Phanerochaete carnosa HHB-10118-sp]|uniref:Uncharacterized protein n=1 Tax=Phanerochaete carnosa (strain HHB-10118-sp) TaxID=650164 RepID=K5WMC4_PHACS|nr:uncharacterized protein PHACADRAFT_246166 [Phanerochaete carnosa HHB-10118-sp]EKM60309.1 hypothetical protein PHACADRAFT_246166 [Phanerochaete carnosa HHB-10118-sp]
MLAPLSNVKTALLVEPVVSGTLPWGNILLSLSAVEELGFEYETFPNLGVNTVPDSQVASGDKTEPALPFSLKSVHAWERHHLHSVLPPAELHSLSMLHHAVRTLMTRSQPASSRFGSVQDVAIQRHTLDFHEHDDGVCRCEDRIFFNTHPEAWHAYLTSEISRDPNPPQSKSWFASFAARIHRSIVPTCIID